MPIVDRVRRLRGGPIARTTTGTFAIRIGANALSLLLTLALARTLGASGYGAYAYALAWVAILGVPATLGLERYLVRGIARYDLREEWSLMRGLLTGAAAATLITALAAAAVAAVVGALLLHGALRTAFLLSMPLVPLTSLTFVRQGAMQGLRRVVQGQLPDFVIRPGLLLIFVGVAYLVLGKTLTPEAVLVMAIAAAALAFAFGSVLLLRAIPEPARLARPVIRAREWLRETLPMMLLAAIGVSNVYVVTVTLGTFTTATAAGQFNVIARGAEGILLLSVAINAAIAPHIARSFATGDLAEIQRLVRKAARIGLLWTTPVAVLMVVFNQFLLGLFGPAFKAAGTPFAILILGQVFNVAMGPAGTLLLMTQHERRAALCFGTATASNVVLALILVPTLGLLGGALSATLAVCVAAALLTWSANRLLAVQTLGLTGGRPDVRRPP